MFNIISKSECVAILRKSLKEESLDCESILKFTIKRAPSDLVGFMGEYFKLFVELKDKRQLSYFIKSVPIMNEIHRKECLDKKYFEKESRIYTDLLGNIQKFVSLKLYPECYFARSDILVLEDLSTLPLRHLTYNESIPFEYFEVVLTLLAHLHAGSIAYEHQAGMNIGERYKDVFFELQMTMNNPWFVTGLKGIVSLVKRIPKYKGTPMEDFIANELYNALCSVTKLTEASAKYRNVLCHRDAWSSNIFFECDATGKPVGCLVVDFQCTMYCPPAIDVLTFLYLTTGRQQRDAIYDKFLNFYYNTLLRISNDLAIPNEISSKLEFLESCNELRLVPLIWKAICAPLVHMPEGLSNKWRAEERECFDGYMNRNREEMFDRIMSLDPTYKSAIYEPLEELIVYLEKKLKIH